VWEDVLWNDGKLYMCVYVFVHEDVLWNEEKLCTCVCVCARGGVETANK